MTDGRYVICTMRRVLYKNKIKLCDPSEQGMTFDPATYTYIASIVL